MPLEGSGNGRVGAGPLEPGTEQLHMIATSSLSAPVSVPAPGCLWRLGVQVDERGEVVVDSRMQTSVAEVYGIGDLIGPPMEMFKARKCGMTAARNIMGEPYEFDFSEYPDFLHSTYEVTWVGLTEDEARERHQRGGHPDAAHGHRPETYRYRARKAP